MSLSTDQVAALVALARMGSLRAAASTLHVTEQGLRNRLLALESRMGVELYRKRRGPRRATPLTPEGRRFLPHAISFLHRADELRDLFSTAPAVREVHVAASQYLIAYLLIGVVARFHRAHPDVRIRLTALAERELEQELLDDPDIALGVAAPYESRADLEYEHLFSMPWSLIAPPRHRLLRRESLALADLAEEPMVFYEPGSTGRQHVIDAFHGLNLSPRIELEATNTDIIVRMVEAGLGISIVPLMAGGVVTRGRRVKDRSLGDVIRPIHSGLLRRRGEQLPEPARRFAAFVTDQFGDAD